MKKLFVKGIRFISFKFIGRNRTRQWLIRLFHVLDFNLLQVAHYERGICKYFEVSDKGEDYFLRTVLIDLFGKNNHPVIFDVGANTGEYTLNLVNVFPSASIYSFEPNPVSYNAMISKTDELKNVVVENLGVGEKESILKMYIEENTPTSQLASLVPGVITGLHGNDSALEIDIKIIGLDAYCSSKKVTKINFLKIDTEGYEWEVLKGARSLLQNNAIDVIQFEFNEMNIYSRVFLKDFYQTLTGYNIFRMDEDKLVYIGGYNSINEIFRYQNFVAIKDELTPPEFIKTMVQ